MEVKEYDLTLDGNAVELLVSIDDDLHHITTDGEKYNTMGSGGRNTREVADELGMLIGRMIGGEQ